MKKNNNKQYKKRTYDKRAHVTSERVKVKAKFLDDKGQALITHNERQIPIPFLLPGEEAMVDLEKNGIFYESRIHSILTPSKHRVVPTCKYFYKCGGCQLQHLNYDKQCSQKTEQVKRLLGGIDVDPIISMENPYHYRNKVIATAGMNKKNVVTGFYKAHSHDLVAVDECEIQMPQSDKILKTIRELCEKHKIQIYNEDSENGFLRHVLIKTAYKTDEVLVTFVVSNKFFNSKAKLIKDLRAVHPEIKSITMNINPKVTSVVLSNEEVVLFGDGKIKDNLCGYDFKISAQSFYQINPVQTEKLYNKAMELADIQKNEVVLDTYSGIGTISIIAAKYAEQVYGVELNKEAIKDANHNARINNIKNVRFVQSDATHAMIQMEKEEFHIDMMFMDPPREGSTPEFIGATMRLKPKKIVYISCDPVTLARDVKLFEKKYRVEKVVPVDMFPHTAHVETIVKLVRK